MEEYKKDDRGRSKAKRLTQTDPHEKVDSSTWTPETPENAGVKTGARPLTKRLFKKGGKVIGADAMKRADRKPRKSGGRTESADRAKRYLTPDNLINRDVRMANEARDGIKHVGAFKKGGKAQKFGGGMIGNNPISDQNQAMGKAAGAMKKGGRAKKRADGGDAIADYLNKNPEQPRGMPGRGMPATGAPIYHGSEDKHNFMSDKNLTTQGKKKGGKVKHDDVAEDKALIKRMVKPEARTGRKSGSEAMHHKDCSCKMCSGGRTMKYGGGGVFSGNSKEKVPGATGGRKAREQGGGTGDYGSGRTLTPREMGIDNEPTRVGGTPNTGAMASRRVIHKPMVGSGRGVSGSTADQMNPPTRMGGTPNTGVQTSYSPEWTTPSQRALGAAIGDIGSYYGNTDPNMIYAKGGRAHHAKGGRTKAGKTTINIVMAGHGQQPQNMPNAPVMPPRPPMGVPVPPPQMAGGAPMMPPQGMPPQMPPQMPRATGGRTGKMVGGSLGNAAGYGQQQPMMGQQPMMNQPMQQPMGYPMPRKSGGRTGYPIDSGAGGGNARLEKIDAYGLTPPKRK